MLFSVLAALATALGGHAPPPVVCAKLPTPPVVAAANDNQVRAGKLEGGVLTVRLVAQPAAWRPDGPTGCALSVNAFAEEGKPARVPGPLIRVRAGTEVRVVLRNSLATALWVLGLQDQSNGVLDSTQVAPGATHEFRVVPHKPGAWYYWAGSSGSSLPASNADGQLAGAFIVDSATADPTTQPNDRVMVLTRWNTTGTGSNKGFQINAFNGLSWPNTERLSYTVGDSVRWQVINATNMVHEMHLHGFFFRMDAKGYAVDTAGARPVGGLGGMRVTVVLRPGEWVAMSWSPERAGNWLWHCHLTSHMSGAQRLDRLADAGANGHEHPGGSSRDHADHDMGGLVMGVEVRPAAGRTAALPAPPARARSIDLYANRRANRFGNREGNGFVMQEGSLPPAEDSIRIPGTPLILTRGEPVRITVHNRLTIPLSVHWHGLELDSYFDGVGGFSGAGRQIAPMIAPKDSFVVRFTPPRAGSFMYHVHGESGEELASGLYGPLVVVDSGKPFDPTVDRVFMLADGGPGENPPVFINGSASPDTLQLTVGKAYRFRLLYLSANDVLQTALLSSGGPVPVRLLAFDGYAVPTARPLPPRPFNQPAGPGHTVDIEVTFDAPGDYRFTGQRIGRDTGSPVLTGAVTAVAIKVR